MRETLEWQGEAPLTLMLAPGTVLRLAAGRCRHIECRTGLLWLSDAPAGKDQVLLAGQAVRVSSDVVLSGLPRATISVSHCSASSAAIRQAATPPDTRFSKTSLESS